MTREIRFYEAIREALDIALTNDPRVYLMGLGAPDPKGIFGTTQDLVDKHGANRVMDIPCSENGITGVAIGSAITGMRPVISHQRVDFAILAMEQMVNQAAKWHYMFGGQMRVPLVIRLIIGRGWGQGPQHSQSLQAWFAHIPGLKVVMPATPVDAKGLLLSSIEDDSPVIFLEHRWLYNTFGPVPDDKFHTPLGKARIARPGKDLTIVAISHMVIEALRAAEHLAEQSVDVEVIDVRTLRPLDTETILESVGRTGRLLVADTSWKTGGFSGEIVALAAEHALDSLRCPPRRVALADCPSPTTRALARHFFPGSKDIFLAAADMLGLE